MKTPIRTYLSAVVMTAFLIIYAAFIPQSKALDSLTNGLISYWPMDSIVGGVLTPDVVRGYNLLGYAPAGPASNVSLTNANNNVTLIPGIRGNAILLTGGNPSDTNFSTRIMLSYIGHSGSLLPINQWTNYTVSFWVKAQNTNTVSNSGSPTRVWGEYNTTDNNPFMDLEIINNSTGLGYDNRQSASVVNGIQYGNFSGASLQTLTNANAIDGNWHNVTFVQQIITNMTVPIITPTNIAPVGGSVQLSWNSIPLDNQFPNWTNQVDTNQNYLVQISTNLSTGWRTIATVTTLGRPGPTTYTDANATNVNAFYRVVQPRVRLYSHRLYVDGINLDTSLAPTPYPNGAANYDAPNGAWKVNNMTFGGYLRTAGICYMDGAFDDAATWNRVLTTNEIAAYITDGITNPPNLLQPLFATLTPAFPTVVSNDIIPISWSASADASTFTLAPAPGNVTSVTTFGIGTTNVTVTSNTLYALTVTRTVDSSSLSVTSYVNSLTNVASGWHYIDDFNYLPDGGVDGLANWINPSQGVSPGGSVAALAIRTAGNGNNYVSFDGDTNGIGGFAVKPLSVWSSTLNNSNTLFFRFYINSADEDGHLGFIPDIDIQLGITSVSPLRDVSDTASDNNFGPSIRIFRSNEQLGGPIDLVAKNGPNTFTNAPLTPDGYSYVDDSVNNPNYSPSASSVNNGLLPGHVYAAWIDIQNLTNVVSTTTTNETSEDLYSVSLQDETAAGPVHKLFTFISTRDYVATGGGETINELVLNMNYVAPTAPATGNPVNGPFFALNPTIQVTNEVSFDDFYISANGSGVGGGNDGIHTDKPVPAKTASSFTP